MRLLCVCALRALRLSLPPCGLTTAPHGEPRPCVDPLSRACSARARIVTGPRVCPSRPNILLYH